jgi:hypothetical protein
MAPAAPRRHHPVDELLLAAGTWLVVGGLAVGHLTFPLRTNGMRPSAGFAVGLEREFQ